ncbi:hypothetical protein JCM3770_004385 [Rhodotorula araucariae]
MSFSTWPGYLAGHRWTSEPWPSVDDVAPPRGSSEPRRLWTRPLGVLEAKFDKASQTDGQSDTFVRLALSLDALCASDSAVFLSRLLLAWAALRAKHPLLACTVRDAPERMQASIPLVQMREFALLPPVDADEALHRALRTLLVHSADAGESVQAATDEVQDRLVLNGPRVLLDDECLARLVVVRGGAMHSELGFLLVISHVISDGLSVFKLVNELFTIASSPALPSPPTTAPFLSLASVLDGAARPAPWRLPSKPVAAWQLVLPAQLPLANEEHYPPLPLSISPAPSTIPAQPTENPHSTASLPATHDLPPPAARQRWLWAITRVVIMARQRNFPRTLYFPRLPHSVPPPQARNRWPSLRFERETSQRMIRFSKANGVSPSMLLYSLISLSVSRIFARVHAREEYRPIVLGFPFSARPFLQRLPPFGPPAACSDPASDCAIRITFGCIVLPSLALDAHDPAQAAHVRAAALSGARLAKAQFAANLAPVPMARTVFVAGMYAMILDRLLNGTGRNPIPYNEPKTALNASMIGDVDRLLPTSFTLPSSLGATLRLRDIAIGTRLHRGEGMLLEAFTWDGQVTLCLGVDDGLMDPALAVLIDLSGTLHVGDVPTRGAAAAIRRLRDAGIVLRFVSNTSKESRKSLLTKMQKMDLDVREEELFTSLSAVRDLVHKRNLNPLYLLTPSALSDFPAPSPPYDSVVVGLAPNAFGYDKLNEAFRLLAGEEGCGTKGEVPLVVTHKARYFGDKDGKLSLGPGPFISGLEEAVGCQAEIVGKPSKAFFQLALDSLASHGIDNSEIGMIGDDWYQDVGPATAGLRFRRFLVRSGKYRPGDEDRLEHGDDARCTRPEWVGKDFSAAVDAILAE